MMEKFVNRLNEIENTIIDFFGVDLDEHFSRSSISIGLNHDILQVIHKNRSRSDIFIKVAELYSVCFPLKSTRYSLYDLTIPKLDDIVNGTYIRNVNMFGAIKKLHDLYSELNEKVREILSSDKLDLRELSRIQTLVELNLKHVGLLYGGDETIDGTEKIVFGKYLPISERVEPYLESLRSVKIEKDVVLVNLLGHISNIGDVFNHFYVVIRKGSSMWIFKDGILPDNPFQAIKMSRRNGVYDEYDENLSNYHFPYKFIYKKEDLQKKYIKDVIKEGENGLVGTFLIPMSDIDEYHILWYRQFSIRLIQMLVSKKIPKFTTTLAYVEKLITSKKDTVDVFSDEGNFSFWSYVHKNELRRVLSTTSKKNGETIKQTFDTLGLTTTKDFGLIQQEEKIKTMFIYERNIKIANELQNKINDEHSYFSCLDELTRFLNKHIKKIYEKLYYKNEIVRLDLEHNESVIKRHVIGTIESLDGVFNEWNTASIGDMDICSCCDMRTAKAHVLITIKHVDFLMYLLGLKLTDIPKTFKNYAAKDLKPYTGNSILNNTNPLNLVMDAASKHFSGGIRILLYISKRCLNEKIVLKQTKDINLTTGEITYKNINNE